jgi:hypothetical protein
MFSGILSAVPEQMKNGFGKWTNILSSIVRNAFQGMQSTSSSCGVPYRKCGCAALRCAYN